MWCAGMNQNILWGEVDKVGDELFWCHGGSRLPAEIAINGTMDAPFYLASLAGMIPNLNAIQGNNIYANTEMIHCVYSNEVFEQCKSGLRAKEMTMFEKALNMRNNV